MTHHDSRQIIAMGGGGFVHDPTNLAVERYILQQAREARPRVCYLVTASENEPGYIGRFYEAFGRLDCVPTHLSLYRAPAEDLAPLLLRQDVIFACGGITRNLIALWRAWRLDAALRAAWEQGVVLSGSSAGAVCWFEEALSRPVVGQPLHYQPCLGFLPGSHCVHYNNQPDRRPAYHREVANGTVKPGYATDENVALHFAGTQLRCAVSSDPHAHAYELAREPGGVTESELPVTVLTPWP